MNFAEKLSRATEGKNKQRVGVEAGLPPTAISDYISKGHLPRADKLLSLARVLGVPLDFLLDDSRDWPPPDSSHDTRASVQDAPIGDLIAELAKRFRLDLLEAMRRADEAEREDWSVVARELKKLKKGQRPSPAISAKLAGLYELFNLVSFVLMRYDVRVAADFLHEKMPGRDRPIESMTYDSVVTRLAELHKRPGFTDAADSLATPGMIDTMAGASKPLALSTILDLIDQNKRLEVFATAKSARK